MCKVQAMVKPVVMLVSLLLVLLVQAGAQVMEEEARLTLVLDAAGLDFSYFAWIAENSNAATMSLPLQGFTLFAPTNTAIQAQMDCFNSSILDDKYKLDLIKYHIINESMSVGQIRALITSRGQWLPTTLYNHHQLNLTSNASTLIINNFASIVKPDAAQVTHVHVHGIDHVLIPPSLQNLTAKCIVAASASPPSLLRGKITKEALLLATLISVALTILS